MSCPASTPITTTGPYQYVGPIEVTGIGYGFEVGDRVATSDVNGTRRVYRITSIAITELRTSAVLTPE